MVKVPDVVRWRADPTAVEAGPDNPRSTYRHALGLDASLLPGIHSVWYRTECEGSGKRSGWKRDRRWAMVGGGRGLRSLRGVRWCKDLLVKSSPLVRKI